MEAYLKSIAEQRTVQPMKVKGLHKIFLCWKHCSCQNVDGVEAQDNADKYSTELERIKYILQRTEEEKKRLADELYQVKEMLKREVQKAENDFNKNTAIITEYKKINRRLESEKTAAKTELNQLKARVSGCEKCRLLATENSSDNSEANMKSEVIDSQAKFQERIKELELELAQAKLAQVEAECQNQDLTHQLSAALSELQTARYSWSPWLHKTLSSIKEVAANKATQNQRRDSAPADTLAREETGF